MRANQESVLTRGLTKQVALYLELFYCTYCIHCVVNILEWLKRYPHQCVMLAVEATWALALKSCVEPGRSDSLVDLRCVLYIGWVCALSGVCMVVSVSSKVCVW